MNIKFAERVFRAIYIFVFIVGTVWVPATNAEGRPALAMGDSLDAPGTPTGGVWTVNYPTWKVAKTDASGSVLFARSFDVPRRLAVDPRDGSAWVAGRGSSTVPSLVKYDADGNILFSSLVYNIAANNGRGNLEVDWSDGSLWIKPDTGANAGKVVKLNMQGEVQVELSGFSSEGNLAIDQQTGDLYVADNVGFANYRIYKYDREGNHLLDGPTFSSCGDMPGLAVDQTDGSVYSGTSQSGDITRYDADLNQVWSVRTGLSCPGYYEPITVSPLDGSIWIIEAAPGGSDAEHRSKNGDLITSRTSVVSVVFNPDGSYWMYNGGTLNKYADDDSLLIATGVNTGYPEALAYDVPSNAVPVITEGDSVAVTMSVNGIPKPFNLTLNATDADAGDTLTWSILTQAGHGTASASGTGLSKEIGYSPETDFVGTDSFSILVDDGNGGTDSITVNVTIGAVTLYVPDDYSTIQAAVDAANPGDTVFVRADTYYEHVVVSKSLTLQGEDKTTTIIDGGGSGYGIHLPATDNATISDFTVRNCRSAVFFSSGANYNTVANMIAANSEYGFDNGDTGNNHNAFWNVEAYGNSEMGISAYAGSDYTTIINSNLHDNFRGVAIGWSSHWVVSETLITGNEYGLGIDAADYGTVVNNVVTDNTFDGIIFNGPHEQYNTITENRISGNARGLAFACAGRDNDVTSNEISDNEYGIFIARNDACPNYGNSFYHNTFSNNAVQAQDDEDRYGGNIWDNGYPSGGNTWSNYAGIDLFSGAGQDVPGADGIGDTPYVILAGLDVDRYPLYTPVKVGLVTDVNGIADNSLSWMAYQGLQQAEAAYGIDGTLYQPASEAEYATLLQQCVTDGNELCFGVSFMMMDAVVAVANANPDTRFAILDVPLETAPANLRGITFDEKQVGYLAGALAGKMTVSNKVGAVAGMEITPVIAFAEGYRNGAQCANSNASVTVDYTGSFDNFALGEASAQTMISLGVDTIFGVGGENGIGGITYGTQHGTWGIGVDADQYVTVFGNGTVTGSDKMLTSAMKKIDFAVKQTVYDYITDAFSSGTVTYHLADGGVGLAPYHETDDDIPSEVKSYVDGVKAGILGGSIDINETCRSVKVVTLWHAYGTGSAEETALMAVIANAEAADPELDIVPVFHAFETIYSDYEIAVNSGMGPDMYIAPNDNLANEARDGQLLNLDGYLVGELTNFNQTAIDGMKVDGILYGVPESAKAVALYYNKSQVPTPPASTAELLSIIEGGATLAVPASGSYFLYGFWSAFGGQLMDGSGYCTADEGGFAEAMQYFLDLQAAGANVNVDYGIANDGFRNGDYDMLINGPWALADYLAALGADLGVVVLPAGPIADATAMNGVDGFFINPHTANPAEVVAAALYMTNQASSQIFTDTGRHIPVRTDVTSSDPNISAFSLASAQGEPRPLTWQFNNYWGPFGQLFDNVLGGSVSPAEGVATACSVMNFLNSATEIATGLNGPFGMDFDAAGNLYVANEGGGFVSKITPSGVNTTFSSGYIGSSGIAINSSDGIYVSDDTNRVFVLDSGGNQTVWLDDTYGFPNPNALAFDDVGNLYVLNAGGWLAKFDSAGNPITLRLVDGLNTPQGIVVDNVAGEVFVSDWDGKVFRVNATTGETSIYAYTWAHSDGGMARDSAGNIYVSAIDAGMVLRVDAATQEVTTCMAGIDRPRGLAFDDLGRLYVTEYNNGRIWRVDGCMINPPPAPTPNPSFSARLTENQVHGYGWPLGSSVTLTIDDSDNGVGVDYTDTRTVVVADWDPNQTFVQFDLGSFVLAAGQQVSMSEGGITKTHTVTNLVVTTVDPDADIVSGTADAGTQVDIGHIYCDQNGCYGFRREIADPNGDWLADFSVAGEDSDEQDIVDIEPGMNNEARQCDDDGDCTQHGWHAPNPVITYWVPVPTITSDDWPPGIPIQILVDNPATPENPDFTDTDYAELVTENPNYPGHSRLIWDAPSPDTILPTYVVTVTNGTTTRELIVSNVQITDVDLETDTVSGSAEPFASVGVHINDSDAGRPATADASGLWSVDFSVPEEGGGLGSDIVYDITLGTRINAFVYDADRDATAWVWSVPNPSFSACLTENQVHGYEWPLGSSVTLTIDDPDNGVGVDYTDTRTVVVADWDPNQTFVQFDLGSFVLEAGQQVSMSEGGITKTHTVTSLIVTAVDPDLDTVSGTAEAATQVDIGHIYCDENGCTGYRRVIADTNGDWIADFAHVGEDSDEQDIIDITPGMGSEARQCDNDGECTTYGWYVPNLRVNVRANTDSIEGQEWLLGTTVTVTVDDPATPASPDITRTAEVYEASWNPGEYRFDINLYGSFDIKAGFVVTAGDGVTTKTHTVTSLAFTGIDVDTDTVTGTAAPDSNVDVWTCDNNGCYNIPTVSADGGGVWSANFTGIYDIVRGTWVDSSQNDEDGDGTFHGQNVPNPYVEASPNSNWIHAREWPTGTLMTLTIDDPSNGGGVDYTTTATMGQAPWNPGDPNDIVADFNLNGYDVKAGDIITASGNGESKTLTVSQLAVTGFDNAADTVSGTGLSGAQIQVCANVPNRCITRYVTPDGSGNWTANYGVAGVPPDDTDTFDVQPDSNGWAAEYELDSDRTWVDWYVPNPQMQAQLEDDWVEGWNWPEDTLLLLTIDDDQDPGNGVLFTSQATASTENIPPWVPAKTMAVFSLGGIFDIQPGQTLVISGGVLTKSLHITELAITSVDMDTDTVFGIAQAFNEVRVNFDPFGISEERRVNADENGNWSANFGDTSDIVRGSNGMATIWDDDGDWFWVEWRVPNTRINARLNENAVEGYEFLGGTNVTLQIDDPNTPEPVDYTASQYANYTGDLHNTSLRFDLGEDFTLESGHTITMTDGVTTKTLIVPALGVTGWNVAEDTISGTASSSAEVWFDLWADTGTQTRHITADGADNWTADYSVFGDEDFEQNTYDVVNGTSGEVRVDDDDGDSTFVTWTVYTPWIAPDAVPFVVGITRDVKLNQPQYYLEDWYVLNLLYEPLYRVSQDGTLIPAAATGYTISGDSKLFTFTLRSGMLWSDGTPVTAQHYADGLLWLLDPTTSPTDYGNAYASLLYDIQGAEAFHQGQTADPNTVGVTAPNSTTLQITLVRPAVHLPHILSIPGMIPVRKDLIMLHDSAWIEPANFAGNGPYKLDEHDGTHFLFGKNTYYYNADQVAFTQVAMPIIPDTNEQFEAYKRGEVDAVLDAPRTALDDANYTPERVYSAQPGFFTIGLNTKDAPTDNLLVRKALASAIDRRALLDNVLDFPWRRTSTGIIPPEIPGYQGDAVGFEYNPTLAQNLLADAGYPGGLGLPTVHLYGYPSNQAQLDAIADQWRTVLGISVETHYRTDFGSWMNNECMNDLAACDSSGVRLGWFVDYFDANNIIGDWFNYATSRTGWDNIRYREVMDLIRTEQDPAQRIAYIQEAEQILVEDDAAVIPLYFNDRVSLVKPGFTTAFGIVPYFEQWQDLTVHYVTPAGTGNCSSWATACSLQTALTAADSGDEIWVAAGTYKPTTGSDRTATFQLKSGVAVYGGFSGTETAREQRDWQANLTILSGDIDQNDTNYDGNYIAETWSDIQGSNAYHVVTGSGVDETAMLDGFIITAGLANGAWPDNRGGGMYNESGSPTLTNVTFSGNSTPTGIGGGMYNRFSNSTLTNVTFSNNSAYFGGGMCNEQSNLTLTNITFSSNSAYYGGGIYHSGNDSSLMLTDVTFSGNSAEHGGGLYNDRNENHLALTNVTFSGNSARQRGGGMFNDRNYHLALTNVTFSNNSASEGGGMYNYHYGTLFQTTLTNVTFSGNTAGSAGGGMYNYADQTSAPVPVIRNTILWGNTAPDGTQMYNNGSAPTVTDSIIQGGCPAGSACTNILTADPLLGVLGDYGGFTQTIPLLPGSSAINAGNGTYCTAGSDQRGVGYVGACDIGAFESRGFTLGSPTGTPQSAAVNTAFALPLGLIVTANSAGEPVDGGVVTFTPPASGASAVISGSPAVIAGGAVSVTASANGTPGTYLVTASANGAVASVNFSLENIPDALTPLTPSGTLTTWDKSFSWVGLSNATWYLIEVQTAGGTQVFRKWYTSAQTNCAGGTDCSVIASELSLANGDYKWRVLDYGAYGYGTNSAFKTFTLDLPCYTLTTAVLPAGGGTVNASAPNCGGGYTAGTVVQLTAVPNSGYVFKDWTGDVSSTANPGYVTMTEDKSVTANFKSAVTPLTPTGTLTSWDKSFTWTGLVDATWYLIEAQTSGGTQVFRKWYTSAQTNCVGGTDCSVVAAELSLANGDYKWRVMDYGAYGYGTNSAFKTFTLNLPCYTLTMAVLPAGGGTVNASAPNCGGGYTAGSVVQLTAVPNSGYVFKEWGGDAGGTANPGSVTMTGDKSVTANFKAALLPLTPTGTLTSWDKSFTWTGLVDATWYLIEVQTGGGTQVFRKWYTSAQTNCVGGTDCSVTAAEASLANGDYKWRVLDYGTYGYGTNSAFKTFTLNVVCYTLTTNVDLGGSGVVNASAPNCGGGYTAGSVVQLTAVPNVGYVFKEWGGDAGGTSSLVSVTMNGNKSVTANFKATVVLIAPSGTLTSWDNTFTWTGLSDATWYLLEVYTPDGTQVFRKWYTSAQTGCAGGTGCSIMPPETAALAGGGYKWRMLDYGAYGYGTWTGYLNFSIP